jgi:UDP-N-acetylmuramoylalanine--D-glutamate ligase
MSLRDPGSTGTFDARERVLVVGLGRSGVASAQVLRARGCTVYATDEKPRAALEATIASLVAAQVRFVEPESIATLFGELTACVLSPGVPLNGALVRGVQAARVPVFSEIEVAYRIGKAPMVAITGTKGKTTTTALVGAMFRRAGKSTRVGGNIGNALINETFVAAASDWVIAEVSSFQLESIRSFKPRIATILNLSPDHLDRYHSMDEYGEAKFRIFANQSASDVFIGNLDDPIVGGLAEGEAAKRIPSRALWFGITPRRMTSLYVRGDTITYAPPRGDPRPIEIMPTSEIPLLGRHNLSNVLAALSIGLAAELDPGALRAAVREFQVDQSGLRDRGARGLCRADRVDRGRQIQADRLPRDGRGDRGAHQSRRADRRSGGRNVRCDRLGAGRARGVDGRSGRDRPRTRGAGRRGPALARLRLVRYVRIGRGARRRVRPRGERPCGRAWLTQTRDASYGQRPTRRWSRRSERSSRSASS